MSRSRKLPIYKDNYKGRTRLYWRRIRRHIKNYLNTNRHKIYDPNFDLIIPNQKEIINDYDYSDYTIDYLFYKNRFFFYPIKTLEEIKADNIKQIEKLSRK